MIFRGFNIGILIVFTVYFLAFIIDFIIKK